MLVHSAAGLVSSRAAELGVSWCQKPTPEAWHWREGCAFVSLGPPLQGGPLLRAPVPPKLRPRGRCCLGQQGASSAGCQGPG